MQDSAVAAENDMGGPKSTWFHKKKIYFIGNQIVGNGYYLSNVILATVSKANYYGNVLKFIYSEKATKFCEIFTYLTLNFKI